MEDVSSACFTLDLAPLSSYCDWQKYNAAVCQKKLVELLIRDEGIALICACCHPILPDLCARLVCERPPGLRASHQHVGICRALSKLLIASPNLLGFVLMYFKDTPPPFDCLEDVNLESVLATCLRFLRCAEDVFVNLWQWNKLLPLMTHRDPLISWYALTVCSIVYGLSDARVHGLRSKLLLAESPKIRVQVLYEQEQEERELRRTFSATKLSTDAGSGISTVSIRTEDLHPLTAYVGGLLLCRRNVAPDTASQHHNLVCVESTSRALARIVEAVNKHQPVLLEGAVGVGKTSLVEHLAAATGHAESLVSVQLSDQTDSKMLLGSYCCTDMPGQFVWRPGVLTQAVKEGSWIILEDIDTAPMSVISLLLPLLESRVLTLSGHSQSLKCATGFQVFITRRCHGGYSAGTVGTSLVEKLCAVVKVEALLADELKTVVDVSFRELQSISSRLVEVFQSLLEVNTTASLSSLVSSGGALANRRQFSLRDFMKWCSRLNDLADRVPSVATAGKEVFQEALDCFCASISSPEVHREVAGRIATLLGITKPEVLYYCETHQPEVQVAPTYIHIGRSTMSVKETNKPVTLTSGLIRYHAYTRPTVVLLEQLASCVLNNEPVLLVGETGTGKTSTVQHLAELSGHELVVINLSQQTDSSDLLGGFKPVSLQHLIRPFKNDFESLFRKTFSVKKNAKFMRHVQESFSHEKWEILFQLMDHTISATVAKQNSEGLQEQWTDLQKRLNRLQEQLKRGAGAFVFAFVEGKLVDAVRKGHWLLLDEINLASPDTLECLISLMEPNGSILLMEKGDLQPVRRHPDFRLFACMNPATDIGKRNLPIGVRNRFTEFFVAELEKAADLEHLVHEYLRRVTVGHTREYVGGVVRFYLAAKADAEEKFTDGTGHRPHYSLRTLCRGLRLASSNLYGSMERSLFEGLLFSFLTQLDRSWHPALVKLIHRHVLPESNINTLTKHSLPKPETAYSADKFVKVEGYWIQCGSNEPVTLENYVLTPAVKANLKDISRAVAAGRPPVLLQGPTSVGKTSLIRYLASLTGHVCMRINNHEHTDLQEYLGSYVTGASGQLVFQEGVLVTAMRHGHWVILDELNLAPTDVLEALNRVLDDNRELVIPETGHVVKAHPKFMLFATQNPAGLYGGRKMLSRALRNRFIELHFTEMPSEELKTILETLCSIPASYAARMVSVMQDLQTLRKGSSVFEGKHGFITLRDLFRWAERYRRSPKYARLYNWDQHIAEDGFLLLAGRVRRADEEVIIQNVLERRFKCRIDTDRLFGGWSARGASDFDKMSPATAPLLQAAMAHAKTCASLQHLVWTRPLRRLVVLAGRALEFDEPLLLVGETGCGKTTVCQLLSQLRKQHLYSVNCHLHSEAGDFLGGLRPVRNAQSDDEPTKLFEWQDGPLVCAMLDGSAFLVDEISLADDSVLERLNSVLEPERSLLLAEKSTGDDQHESTTSAVCAKEGFCFLATMNPGGDFGKKELSPALRNRFTEVWCPEADDPADVCAIVDCNIDAGISVGDSDESGFGQRIVEFLGWLSLHHAKKLTVSIRDLLSWISFINTFCKQAATLNVADAGSCAAEAYVHGACLVLLDSLGSSQTGLVSTASGSAQLREGCLDFLRKQVSEGGSSVAESTSIEIGSTPAGLFGSHPFFLREGPHVAPMPQFTLKAPTTTQNAHRLLRALQLPRPILLEGSPGVGKTSLVSALAKAAGYKLTRINLSEQTDVTDLFGADLPVENGKGGQFAWRDGPFLSALKCGHWIMLDELNLASQSVLEGLNACLDHRGEVFIPELGKSFQVQHGATRIFACQNPLQQGGGRKGLPKSFLNRFTQVYVEALSAADLLFIASTVYPQFPQAMLEKMILFNSKLHNAVNVERSLGMGAGLWEFNLRDVFRWCDLMASSQAADWFNPGQFVDLLYAQRMRSEEERTGVMQLYLETFEHSSALPLCHLGGQVLVAPVRVQVGQVVLSRTEERPPMCSYTLDSEDFPSLEALASTTKMGWMTILVGSGSVKRSSLVRTLAYCCGRKLVEMPVNSAMDTTELLGGFEQADHVKKWLEIMAAVEGCVRRSVRAAVVGSNAKESSQDARDRLPKVSAQVDTLSSVFTSLRSMNQREPDVRLLEQCRAVLDSISNLLRLAGAAGENKELVGLRQQVDSLETAFTSASTLEAGCFKWVDSLLVTAAREGHWLLLDNANFCSPSVLDRLNAMLEPNGVLTIDERGLENDELVTVSPHASFRLILSMDPKHGELSRAMRNRGVEICLLENSETEEEEEDEDDEEEDGDEEAVDTEAAMEMETDMADETEEECADERPAWNLPLSTICSDSLLANAVHESNVLSMFQVGSEDAKYNELFKMALDLYMNQSGLHDAALRLEIALDLLTKLNVTRSDFATFTCFDSMMNALRSSEYLEEMVRRDDHPFFNVPLDLRCNSLAHRRISRADVPDRGLRLTIANGMLGLAEAAWRHQINLATYGQEYQMRTMPPTCLLATAQAARESNGVFAIFNPTEVVTLPHRSVAFIPHVLKNSFRSFLDYSMDYDLNEQLLERILHALLWRRVFATFVCNPQGWTSYAEMHVLWSWLDEHTVKTIRYMDPNGRDDLMRCAKEMRRLLPRFPPWSAGSEEWRDLIGHPPPLSSREAADCWVALHKSADQLSSSVNGDTLSVAASIGKLAELKAQGRSCEQLLRTVWLSLLVSSPVPEATVEQCRSCLDQVGKTLTACHAAREDPSVFETTSASQQLATSGLEVDLTCYALMSPFLAICLKTAVTLTTRLATMRQGEPGLVQHVMFCEVARELSETAGSLRQYAQQYPLLVPVGVLSLMESLSQLLLCSENEQALSLRCSSILPSLYTATNLWNQRYQQTNLSNVSLSSVVFNLFSTSEAAMKSSIVGKSQKAGAGVSLSAFSLAAQSNSSRFLGLLQSHLWTTAMQQKEGWGSCIKEDLLARFMHVLTMLCAVSSDAMQEMLLSFTGQLSAIAENVERPDLSDGLKLPDGVTPVSDMHPSFIEEIKSYLKDIFEEMVALTEARATASQHIDIFSAAKVAVMIALLKVLLVTPQDRVDPAMRRTVCLEHCQRLMVTLNCQLELQRGFDTIRFGRNSAVYSDVCEQLSCTSEDGCVAADCFASSPHVEKRLTNYMKEVGELAEKNQRAVAYRPEGDGYCSLVMTAAGFREMLADRLKINLLLAPLIHHGDRPVSAQALHSAVQAADNWQLSIRQFCSTMQQSYGQFADVAEPCVAAATELSEAVQWLIDEAKSATQSTLASTELINMEVALCKFPVLPSISTPRNTRHSQSLLTAGVLNAAFPPHIRTRLLVAAYSHLHLSSVLSGSLPAQCEELLRRTQQVTAQLWWHVREEEKRKAEEEASMYKRKGESHGDSLAEVEEAAEENLRGMFPTYDEDFADLSAPSTFENSAPAASAAADVDSSSSANKTVSFQTSDMHRMCVLHEKMLKQTGNVDADGVRSVTLDLVRDSFSSACRLNETRLKTHSETSADATTTCSVDDALRLPALLVCHDTRTTLSKPAPVTQVKPSSAVIPCAQDTKTNYDIYHDPNPAEVQLAQPVLSQFLDAVNDLLEKWPEHPALLQLTVVIRRVLSFPLQSSLMKILQGMELLLQKSQDWESYASREVSLRTHIDAVTDLILRWRRLELKFWPSILESCAHRAAAEASRWWMHLNQLLFGEDGQKDEDAIMEAIQGFIEASPVGEFPSRLRMLNTFYTQMTRMPNATANIGSLRTILWNAYHYYSQFAAEVSTWVQHRKTPLEKELKGFVRIARWNDANYWAIKQATEKTHRKLHSYVVKFKNILAEPVSAVLRTSSVLAISADHSDVEETVAQAPLHAWLSAATVPAVTDTVLPDAELPENVKRLPALSSRIVKLQKRLWKQCPHHRLTEDLNDFAGEIASSIQHLQGLPIEGKTPEERAKAFKRVLVQKRAALTSLFKAAKTIGLSFRKGVRLAAEILEQSTLTLPVLMPPGDCLQEGSAATETELVDFAGSLWLGCHKYFMRCVTRSSALEIALASPSEELTRVELERCRGLSAHMYSLLQEQRSMTSEFATDLTHTSGCAQLLAELKDCPLESFASSGLPGYCSHVESVANVLQCCCQSLVDMQLLLDCCPAGQATEFITPFHKSQVPRLQRLGDNEDVQKASSQVKEWLSSLSGHQAAVHSVLHDTRFVKDTVSDFGASLLAWRKRDTVDTAEKFLLEFHRSSQAFVAELTVGKNVGILKPLAELNSLLRSSLPLRRNAVRGRTPVHPTADSDAKFYRTLDEFAKSLLLATQKLHNLWLPTDTSSERVSQEAGEPLSSSTVDDTDLDDKDPEIDADADAYSADFDEGLLTVKSVDGLRVAIQCIDLPRLHKLCSTLVEGISADFSGREVKPAMASKLDALLLCQSALSTVTQCSKNLFIELLSLHRASSKLLSMMQGVFLELASKGFCRPAEIEYGDGTGAQEFEDLEGMGLGEGEGMKDVSDEIENEDQLEDTHQKDKKEEEKKTEGEDQIKEEENGIEMSEDFDGQLNDADDNSKKEEEEQDDDDDDDQTEELDKQMGDVDGAGEEQLDERMWGDDSEDEQDDKEKDDDEEDQCGGEEVGEESRMVANVDVSEEGKGQRKDEKHGEDDDDQKDDAKNDETDVNEQTMEQDGEDSGDDVDDRQDPLADGPNDVPDNLDLPDDLNVDDEQQDEGKESKADPIEEEEGMDCEDEDDESNKQAQGSPNPELESEEFDPEKEKEENSGPAEDLDMDEGAGENTVQDGAQSTSQDQAMDSEEGAQSASQQQNMDGEDGGQSFNQQQVMDSQDGQMSLDSAPAPQTKSNPSDTLPEHSQRRRNRSAHDRSQMNEEATPAKRRKTTDSARMSEEQKARDEQVDEADLYRHVGDEEDNSVQDVATLDAANAEESRQMAKKDRELNGDEQDGVDDDESEQQPMQDDGADEKSDRPAQLNNEAVEQSKKQKNGDGTAVDDGEAEPSSHADDKEVDWERENRSFASSSVLEAGDVVDVATMERLRLELERSLSAWSSAEAASDLSSAAAAQLWHQYEVVTSRHAQTLCEQLRLVLEPTMAAKLKGDYRTGKRLNMRKVVAYVASQFRKDRIWLRRTKPSKRQYQLLLAVDDSASMTDCHAKQMTFEALAVVTNALRWLEAGQVGVCRFGQTVDLIHPLQETFSQECGARLLQNLTFQQKETSFKQLLTFATSLLTSARAQQSSSPSSVPGQLLIVLSDGRGVFREGKEAVKKAVRTLIQQGIFAVFVVLDSVGNKDSVMDIQLPIFVPGSKPIVKRYMEEFPFPFYVVLRDINSLADVLGSAMRQWFEMLSVEQQ